jgi:hypothetical protein
MNKNGSNETLLLLIEEAFHRKAWHGPNLRSSFRGLSAHEAAWRPSRDRHSICDLVLHTAYWKYAVRRGITGEKRGSFPLEGSNFFRHPVPLTEKAWREDIRILENEHRLLVQAVRTHLSALVSGSGEARARAILRKIRGVAFHDVYHAGQIRLLRRMQGVRR